MKRPIPEFLLTLTEDQIAGKERIDSVPAALWVSDNPASVAKTFEAKTSEYLAIRSPKNPTWRMLRAWKDLVKLGFVVTSPENYRATEARMRGMGDFAS